MAAYRIQMNKSELKDRMPIKVDVGGKAVLLVLIDGQVYAMDAICSHKGGPLEQGTVQDCSIVCPWHGATFDMRTGVGAEETPWGTNLTSYKANVDASGQIELIV
jgi:nitrite reductase/ring-hydroxylating ferredoxin subunit